MEILIGSVLTVVTVLGGYLILYWTYRVFRYASTRRRMGRWFTQRNATPRMKDLLEKHYDHFMPVQYIQLGQTDLRYMGKKVTKKDLNKTEREFMAQCEPNPLDEAERIIRARGKAPQPDSDVRRDQ